MTSGIVSHSFTLLADVATEIGTKVFQAMVRQATYTNTNPIIESVRTLVFKKTFRTFKKDPKKFFDYCLNQYASYGIFQKAIEGYADFQRHAVPKTGGPDGFMNYYSLLQYVEDYSEVDVLKFVQLDYLFRIYFGVLLIACFCNMVHYAKLRFANLVKRGMLKILFWFVAPTLLFGKVRIHPVNQ